MTLRGYFEILKRSWIIIFVAVLLTCLLATIYVTLRPVRYEATTTLYVASLQGDSTTSAYQGSLLSEQRVKSYTDLVDSARVLQDASKSLGATAPPDLAQSVTSSNPPDSVLINITATSETANGAAQIANAIAGAFVGLVADLERPQPPASNPTTAVRVVQPAAPPDAPVSVGLAAIAAFALSVGLAIGVAAALVRHSLDRTIKSAEELALSTHSTLLGSIPELQTSQRTSQHQALGGDGPPAFLEAFRRVRTNLSYINVDAPPRCIIVSSANAGEGKSTTVARLGRALSAAGYRVLLVDADLRRPSLAESLNLSQSVGLSTVISGKMAWERTIQRTSNGSLQVMASGPLPPNPGELLGSERTRSLMIELRMAFDYILIDSSPILPVADTTALVPATDGVIFIARYRKTTSTDISEACSLLTNVNGQLLGSILSRTPGKPKSYDQYVQVQPTGMEVHAGDSYQAETESLSAGVVHNKPTPYRREKIRGG